MLQIPYNSFETGTPCIRCAKFHVSSKNPIKYNKQNSTKISSNIKFTFHFFRQNSLTPPLKEIFQLVIS